MILCQLLCFCVIQLAKQTVGHHVEWIIGFTKLHGPSMLPDKAKFVKCSIISLALSFWIKHLVIGQLQKPAEFSAFLKSGFHWSAYGNQQDSTFTETNRNGLIHHIGCLITPFGPQRTYSWPSLSDFDYILDLVSVGLSGPNHRIGQGCTGHA